MKKKFLSLLLCSVMAITLVSCGGDKEENKDSGNKNNTEVSTNSLSDNEENKDSEEVSVSNNEVDKEEQSEEYKPMTTEEAIAFNSTKIYEMEKLFNNNGFSCTLGKSKKSIVDTDTNVGYRVESGEFPYYKSVKYYAGIFEEDVTVKYELHYYVDKEAIANGAVEPPKARELFIAEPYKVMTGKEINEDILNQIDEEIVKAYVNGSEEDRDKDILLETIGPFKVELLFDGLDIGFIICSYGDGSGN